MVKSERVAMLADGECGVDDPGLVSAPGVTIGVTIGSRSPLGSPRDVITGVAAESSWSAPAGFGLPVVNTGGGGRPSQPLSRNATTS